MLIRFAHIALAMLIAVGLSTRSEAQGQESHDEAARGSEYQELVRLAAEEFNLGNFSEARALFQRAHALEPNARTLRGLGFAEFELRHYPEAVQHLRESLASEVKPLGAELRESTDALLRRAERYIGRVRLSVVPAHAAVTLDGEPIEAARELVVTVGDHVFEFGASGFTSQRRSLQVAGGAREDLSIRLEPLLSERSISARDRERSEVTPLRRKWWVWTSVAALAAAGAVTAVLLSRREPGVVHEPVPSRNSVLDEGLRVPSEGQSR